MFVIDVLGLLLFTVAGIQDGYILLLIIATAIGAYFALRMENQKIKLSFDALKLEQEKFKEEYADKVNKVSIDVKNKIDGTFCDNIEKNHKTEMNGLKILVADLGKDVKEMNEKIDRNHNEVLNTILGIVTNKVIK